MGRAAKKSETLYQVIRLLFEGGRHPEQNYNTCDGLFSLHRKTDPEIFEKACQNAIECSSYSYKFIQRIIENLNSQPDQETAPSPLPDHENIRGRDYYEQLSLNF
jgi:hypothetical protein